MAAAEKIKELIKSYSEGDDERFYAIAMQIAAMEARKGHTKVARDLKDAIDRVKSKRKLSNVRNIIEHPVKPEFREIQDLIEVTEHKSGLESMVLNPSVRTRLERIVQEQQKREELRQYNLMPTRKILLTGPPGCGKTMTAEALASELAIPLFTIRLDGLISRYMGETISKLKMIFDYMNTHRAVYLFDEFDSIGSHRHYGNDVGEIKRVLNSFLVYIEKDRSSSLIVAATNMPEALDKALHRRFDEFISYPLPGKDEIEKLLTKRLTGQKGITRQDIHKIADLSIGLGFADIARAVEDTIKERIISGREELSFELLKVFIDRRKILT